jgi:hypothetical protein
MWRIIIIILLLCGNSHAATVYDHDFNDGTFGTASHGSFWSIQNSGGIGGSAYARCTYSVAGTAGKAIVIPVSSYTTNTLWVEFYTRATSNIKGGSKFIKLFGYDQANSGNESANNLTLALDYNSNINYRVGYFGDSSCTASWAGGNGFNASKPEQLACGDVLHPVTGGSIDIRGTEWDHYKVMVKRANPGQTNGEVKVWWNGNLHAHTTIMPSNPNYSITSPYLKRIEIGGYNSGQDGHFDGDTWYLDVDNVYIGTTEQGVSIVTENGECGPAHGETFETLSSDNPNLCLSTSAATDFTDGTQYNWICPGLAGGAPASCFAIKEVATADEDGVCGAVDGTYSTTEPTTEQKCLKGTVSSETEDDEAWMWMCDGTGEGTDDPCVTYKTIVTGDSGIIRATLR